MTQTLLFFDENEAALAISWNWAGKETGHCKRTSIMLHHENGSAILRKCPPVAGGSVVTPSLQIPGSPCEYISKFSGNWQEAYVAHVF
jgi:hypothetical protein